MIMILEAPLLINRYSQFTYFFSSQITEVGTMNIFMFWINNDGGRHRIYYHLMHSISQ